MLKTLREWFSSAMVAFALALFINAFLFQHMVVEGSSMEPTLREQEHIFINKGLHTLTRVPDYGDIVVIDSRLNRTRTVRDDLVEPVLKWVTPPGYIFVKRVVGRPGDTLEFRSGRIFRNGVLLEEPYLKETQGHDADRKLTVPDGHVFVMGDNRNNSLDSRRIGSVPLDHCLGQIFAKF